MFYVLQTLISFTHTRYNIAIDELGHRKSASYLLTSEDFSSLHITYTLHVADWVYTAYYTSGQTLPRCYEKGRRELDAQDSSLQLALVVVVAPGAHVCVCVLGGGLKGVMRGVA